MKKVIHKNESRGTANHGWLQSRHTFSFSNYYNPERMNFGALRVLNDDTVAESMGFGTHPHRDMEIISIPLEGDLIHKDNMGNTSVIESGDVQVMSAGTGVMHSEYNNNPDRKVKFLQIWIVPNKEGVQPRYDQFTLKEEDLKNRLAQVISPHTDDEGLWIHQDAWFHLGELEEGTSVSYQMKGENTGVYAFVIEGEVALNDDVLAHRDGMGIWEANMLNIKALKKSKILLMEVPMI